MSSHGYMDLRTWVWSDTHFFHRNIARYTGRPADHEARMKRAWREVPATDRLLHLGDLALGARAQVDGLAGMPGILTLVLGNHDRRGRGVYESLGFQVLKRGFTAVFEGWTVHFVHDPADAPELESGRVLVVHGHIHEKLYGDRRFINVSVEQLDYRPVWLPDLLHERIGELEQAAGE